MAGASRGAFFRKVEFHANGSLAVKSKRGISFCATAGVLCVAFALSAAPPDEAADDPDESGRVSVAVARRRAKLMHGIYASTLEVMHDHYFHKNRSTVPARALEEVFAEMARRSKAEARWIAVNTRAMSVNHEPRDEFEKQAAKQIAAGKDEFEQVEAGYYRRAAPIPLAAGCVGCHSGFSSGAAKTPRFAGLVISIPVHE
jgi:hypothetical protein